MLDRAPGTTVTFTLDGEEITVPEGWTIWEAAKGQGLVIPHLCHKPEPGYRPDGNCRVCVVEIEGERTLAASCVRPVAEGMVVNTASERAEKSRAMVMELLVADQPEVAHDASSHFRDMAEAVGVEESRFPAIEETRVPLLADSQATLTGNDSSLCSRSSRVSSSNSSRV